MANQYSVQIGGDATNYENARAAMDAYKSAARTGLPCVIWSGDVAADVSNGYPATQDGAARAQLTADLESIDDASREHLVTIEEMPDQHRGSHRAARNWGQYPANGATRRKVSREEAEEIVENDADGYAHIVE